MTKNCLKSISADSLTGMLFAMEGMKNVCVLLNGPMGCRFYHSTTSQFLIMRPELRMPVDDKNGKKMPVDYNYLNDWFFRQPRVPNTWLDGYDYVYGTAEKVAEALGFLKAHVDFSMIAIINSPGACLIGDNLKELAGQILPDTLCVMLESPGLSKDWYDGYETAGICLFDQLHHRFERCPVKEKSINILGLSIWNRYMEGDREEITRLLNLCGISVNCSLFAESRVSEVEAMSSASLNLVLYPEAGLGIAKKLKELYGTDYYICDTLPVGFKAVEQMVKDICEILACDPTPALLESERARALCYAKINDIYHMCGLPKGVGFYVKGMPSQEKAFSMFFRQYLGMIPVDLLEAELVFSDANVISEMMLLNKTFCGIEINLPGMGYTDIVTKTHLGINGAKFLCEQVLNGLMSKL